MLFLILLLMPCSAKWQESALQFCFSKFFTGFEASVLFGNVSLVANQKEFGEKAALLV